MSMEDRPNSNQSSSPGGILVEFLEVAIACILFQKGIYPPDAFERRRYSSLVVYAPKHPGLRDYIRSATLGLLPFIHKGLVDRVAVIFCYGDSIPLEKFVFKLSVNLTSATHAEEGDLELSLRSFLVKLSVSQPLSKVLPPDCRWEITAYFRSLPPVEPSKDVESWIPTETKQWLLPPLITPIKSMSSEPLCVQLYLEHPSLSESKP